MTDQNIQKLYAGHGVKEHSEEPVRTMVPPVDIQEASDSYIVRFDIPGTDKNKIKVQIEEGSLNVSASVDPYFEKNAVLFYHGSLPREYRREFSLGNNIDTTTVNAVYELGVLTVTLKKKQQFLPIE
ncbi:MAG: Hsp20/alpha crystallin family protein, partial [Bacteroidota bacterium]|nr:Hsp20/alpha crystallin family protein [Bacteroidota bacterium]